MNKFRIILFSTLAAMTYGILHDQITARVCLEYFTVAHPPIFPTRSVTMLAVCWGAASTVGIGLAFGTVLALVSQSAGQPPVPVGTLRRKILALLGGMALAAVGAGAAGFFLSRRELVPFPTAVAEDIPPALRDRFMAAWFAHLASYLVGLAGSAGLVFRVWSARGRPMIFALYPRQPLAVLRAVGIAVVVAVIVWRRFFALS